MDLNTQNWASFPMGPTVRRYLGIQNYQGETAARPDVEKAAEFSDFMLQYVAQKPARSKYELIDLLEELVAMGASDVALAAGETNAELGPENDFRGLLALGSAAMLENDLVRAEAWFKEAQALSPEEPSPYVNLGEIFYHLERDDEALEWLTAGLLAAPNHRRIWELLGILYQIRWTERAGEELRKLAEARSSWAGLSLAAQLLDNDAFLRAELLEGLYKSGERDPDFLVEYTAALGVSQQYQKIPPIVWRAEQLATEALPWQLYAHAAQAQLAMNNFAQFEEMATKAQRDGTLPEGARLELQTLAEELKEQHALKH